MKKSSKSLLGTNQTLSDYILAPSFSINKLENNSFCSDERKDLEESIRGLYQTYNDPSSLVFQEKLDEDDYLVMEGIFLL
jgi:hypothetical protein